MRQMQALIEKSVNVGVPVLDAGNDNIALVPLINGSRSVRSDLSGDRYTYIYKYTCRRHLKLYTYIRMHR